MHTTLTGDIRMYNQCVVSEDCSTSGIVLYVSYINPSRSARKSLIESLLSETKLSLERTVS
jgi:hypothetical protein